MQGRLNFVISSYILFLSIVPIPYPAQMEGISQLKHLELLELYDNQIDELRDLDGSSGGNDAGGLKLEEEASNDDKKENVNDGLPGKNLRVLDISYNVIRDMGPVSLCPNLQELCEWSTLYYFGDFCFLSHQI